MNKSHSTDKIADFDESDIPPDQIFGHHSETDQPEVFWAAPHDYMDAAVIRVLSH